MAVEGDVECFSTQISRNEKLRGYRLTMRKEEERCLKGHSDLYKVLITMGYIISEQRAKHPKTECWKHLVDMVEELREIQRDWAGQRR